jgi:SPP1 family phage portal protein
LNTSRSINIDSSGIVPTFTRALPKNLLEISQIVANLWGKVSKKTLLSQIPFVDNPDEELEAVEKETKENMEQQKEMFGIGTNTPPDDDTKDDVDE